MSAAQQPEERPDDAAPAPSGGALATPSSAASAPLRVWENLRDYVAHGGHLADTRRMPRLPVRHGEG